MSFLSLVCHRVRLGWANAVSGRPSLQTVLVGVAAAVGALHFAHLLYLESAHECPSLLVACPRLLESLTTPDTNSYFRVAKEITEKGLFSNSYFRRTPGLPLAFASMRELGLPPATILWAVPLLAAAAAWAIGWIGWRVSGKAGVAVTAALGFAAWPSAYQYAPLLMTDGAHGFLAVAALAATLWWRDSGASRVAVLAALLWAATQSLRPTFFPVPLLLPLLLFRRGSTRARVATAAALWLATCTVPAFVLVSNQIQHGRPLPRPHCYAVPRLQHQMGLGSFWALRQECKQQFRRDPDGVVARERAFLLAHPREAAWSFGSEILSQTVFGPRPFYSRARLACLYPAWTQLGWGAMAAFWTCAFVGLLGLARRDPGLALFLAGSFVMVMLPAANVTLVGGRIRFPLDLLFLPIAVAGAWRMLSPLRRVYSRSTTP